MDFYIFVHVISSLKPKRKIFLVSIDSEKNISMNLDFQENKKE